MKLQELRKRAGLSQAQLAQKADVNYRILQYYEQGSKDINKASAITIYKLSKALKCKMEDLIEKDNL